MDDSVDVRSAAINREMHVDLAGCLSRALNEASIHINDDKIRWPDRRLAEARWCDKDGVCRKAHG